MRIHQHAVAVQATERAVRIEQAHLRLDMANGGDSAIQRPLGKRRITVRHAQRQRRAQPQQRARLPVQCVGLTLRRRCGDTAQVPDGQTGSAQQAQS